MRAIVFAGPTIGPDEVTAVLDAECRPPAAQGDVYSAALARPRCIGIIDGYFDGVPSVWHKEILWAMAEGIAVFGSASMGALRAAELGAFGMRGIGRIFEDYREGRLEDDDEVAVLHAPGELSFTPLSEPMVSIRATVERALAAGVLGSAAAAALLDAAKAMHYRDRTWQALLAGGVDEVGIFRDWLSTGRVDAKREDAVAMLHAMASWLEECATAPPAEYHFEWTDGWRELSERVKAEASVADREDRLVLDELRLDAERFGRVRDRAVLRHLAAAEARRRGVELDRKDLVEQMARHRTERGLQRRRDLARWLAENRLDETGYEALVGEDALAAAGSGLSPGALARGLTAELKWSGEFGPLLQRALEKESMLAGRSAGAAPGGSPHRLNLLVWHFEHRLGQPMPTDLDAHARALGLATGEELYRVLEREYLYSAAREGAEAREVD